jgi:hypothetical protein
VKGKVRPIIRKLRNDPEREKPEPALDRYAASQLPCRSEAASEEDEMLGPFQHRREMLYHFHEPPPKVDLEMLDKIAKQRGRRSGGRK